MTIFSEGIEPALVGADLGEEVPPVLEGLDIEELQLNQVVNGFDVGIVSGFGDLEMTDPALFQGLDEVRFFLGAPASDELAAAVGLPTAVFELKAVFAHPGRDRFRKQDSVQ